MQKLLLGGTKSVTSYRADGQSRFTWNSYSGGERQYLQAARRNLGLKRALAFLGAGPLPADPRPTESAGDLQCRIGTVVICRAGLSNSMNDIRVPLANALHPAQRIESSTARDAGYKEGDVTSVPGLAYSSQASTCVIPIC